MKPWPGSQKWEGYLWEVSSVGELARDLARLDLDLWLDLILPIAFLCIVFSLLWNCIVLPWNCIDLRHRSAFLAGVSWPQLLPWISGISSIPIRSTVQLCAPIHSNPLRCAFKLHFSMEALLYLAQDNTCTITLSYYETSWTIQIIWYDISSH